VDITAFFPLPRAIPENEYRCRITADIVDLTARWASLCGFWNRNTRETRLKQYLTHTTSEWFQSTSPRSIEPLTQGDSARLRQ
jgi:hypothetical protein